MSSIRGHLLAWFIPGYILLWLLAGGATYFAARTRHEGQLEQTLRNFRNALPLGGGSSTDGPSIDDLALDEFGLYFQIRSSEGTTILKSENLGRFELPFLSEAGDIELFRNAVLENGDPVRLLALRSNDGSLGPLHLTLAVTREEMVAALRETSLLILVMGALSGGLFFLLLAAALRSALAPLDEVGTFATGVDADHLSGRMPEGKLPRELLPIAGSINTLMDRLERAFASEKRFGADLAHEFRTPLAAIRATAEVALRFPGEDSAEPLRDIVDVAGTLQATIDNLLILAKLSGEPAPLHLETVDLDESVSRVWKLLEEKAARRQLNLVRESADEPTLQTDPELLRLILINLLGNAVEYAPIGGTVTVSTGGERLFSVSNPAPHLAEGDLPRLFERLWRHDTARTDSSHCGLGLSLARSCAELLSLDLAARLRDGHIDFTLDPKPVE